MALMFVLIMVIAFIEGSFFFYLRRQARDIASRQASSYTVQVNAENDMREAEKLLKEALGVYNGAIGTSLARHNGQGTIHDASVKGS